VKRGPLRIVLIEDNPADVYLIEQALSERGIPCEIQHFASGDEALEFFHSTHRLTRGQPDLILLDLHLPGTQGDEVLRIIRHDPYLMSVPVAIISGADLMRLRDTDLAGSNRIIRKSMDLDVYLQDVGDAVSELCGVLESPG